MGRLVGVGIALASFEGLAAADCPSTAIRWAGSSNTAYVSGAVTCTLTDVSGAIAKYTTTALQEVDTTNKIWILRANLVLQNGAQLNLHGTPVGGDVDQFRLKSNNVSGGTIYVRAYWGTIDIDSTKITSWDEAASGPDTKPATYGRSYIHVRSYLDADGVTPHESTMNIRSSDVGYLGYDGSEAYGLVWEVYGTTTGIFDKVNVYGDVTDSYLHDNWFGAYTYGAYQMHWLRNESAHNWKYGLDPHDDSDSLDIEDNDIHDNGDHGIICSQRCDHLEIKGNHSYRNKGNGIMLHRRVTDSVVEQNECDHNTDSGVAIFDSYSNTIQDNYLHDNSRGVRLSVGATDNVFDNNEISNNSSYAFYLYKGSDAPTSGDGHPKNNTFSNNNVHDNGQAVKLTMGDDNLWTGNTYASNSSGFLLLDAVGNDFSGESIPSTSIIDTKTSSLSAASTTISGIGTSLKVQSEGGGVTTFAETSTWTHMFGGLASTVTSSGSTLALTSAQIGSASTVAAVRLFAQLTSGTIYLTPTSWSSTSHVWTARASGSSTSATFRIGGLTPSTTYTVKKNGNTLTTVTTNGGGIATFSDTVTTTTATYSI